MTFAILLLCTVLVCLLLRKPLRRYAVVFYVLAVIVDLVYLYGIFFPGVLPRAVTLAMLSLIGKCTLALALFVVVMYVGVLPRTSKPYIWFKSVRAELSILACILAVGHMGFYMKVYAARVFGEAVVKSNMLVAFCVAAVLLVLIVVLGITSFKAIKKRMNVESWKKLQKLAYPFYVLVYVHLAIIMLPAALRGGKQAMITLGVYSVVFIIYFILRIYRAYADKKNNIQELTQEEIIAEHASEV